MRVRRHSLQKVMRLGSAYLNTNDVVPAVFQAAALDIIVLLNLHLRIGAMLAQQDLLHFVPLIFNGATSS